MKKNFKIKFLEKHLKELIRCLIDELNIFLELIFIPFRINRHSIYLEILKPKNELCNNKSFNVLITGGYGYGNTGDEAQLNANIIRWKNKYPVSQLKVLSPNPDYTNKNHNIHSIYSPRVIWFNSNKRSYYWMKSPIFYLKFLSISVRHLIATKLINLGVPPIILTVKELELLLIIKQSNILHISGGGYLTGMTRSRLWENALLIIITDSLNTKTIMTGQTIGVFKSLSDKIISYHGFKKVQYISLRDPFESKNDLNKIGIVGNHIETKFDDALFCEKAQESSINSSLLSSGIDIKKKYGVINYHFWGMDEKMKKKSLNQFAKLCQFITKIDDIQLLLLPMTPSDIIPLEQLKKAVDYDSRILKYNFEFQISRGVISKSKWVFTMKHHPIIFAQGEGVPAIAVSLDDYYFRKNLGALCNFNHEKYCLHKKIFFSDKSETIMEDFINNNEIIKSEIISKKNEFLIEENHLLKKWNISD